MPITPGTPYAGHTFTAEQIAVITTITAVGRSVGASDRDLMTAYTAGYVESRFRNLHYGDRDSLGVFQQRAPWGTVAQRTDVAESTRMFFTGGHGGQRGLFDIPNRGAMSIGAAAQAVQVSAFPARYDAVVPMAQALLAASGGTSTVDTGFQPAGVVSGVTGAVGFLINPGNWLRVGLFIMGGLLMLIGGMIAIRGSEKTQDVAKVAVEMFATKGGSKTGKVAA